MEYMTCLIAVLSHLSNLQTACLCTDKEVFLFDASVNMKKNVIIIYEKKNVREENMCYSVAYFEPPLCKDRIYTFAICKNIMQTNILLIVIVYD